MSANPNNSLLNEDVPNSSTNQAFGASDIKLTDFYITKSFKNFDLSLEIPLFSGSIGNVYQNNSSASYQAQGFIFEAKYNYNSKWNFFLNAGLISGDDGNSSSFEALYLNPNYHVGLLMFRYNPAAISNNSKNIYDAYITNATYLKFLTQYQDQKSLWSLSFLYAKANETAEASQSVAFNHQQNRTFTPQTNQDESLGMEIDLEYSYQWNDEMSLQLAFGYHFAGDYYAFTNNSSIVNEVENSYLVSLGTMINF